MGFKRPRGTTRHCFVVIAISGAPGLSACSAESAEEHKEEEHNWREPKPTGTGRRCRQGGFSLVRKDTICMRWQSIACLAPWDLVHARLLLVLGAMLDIFAALVIMVPLLLPVAVGYGIHPVHLGIIFLANMQVGYFTPPVGMNLFIASYRFKKPLTELYTATLPFMLILLLAVLIITYVPFLSLWHMDLP